MLPAVASKRMKNISEEAKRSSSKVTSILAYSQHRRFDTELSSAAQTTGLK
jgi:hypothetical protein